MTKYPLHQIVSFVSSVLFLKSDHHSLTIGLWYTSLTTVLLWKENFVDDITSGLCFVVEIVGGGAASSKEKKEMDKN